MLFTKLLIFIFSIQFIEAQNFYDKSPNIIELTPKNFEKVVHRTNYSTLVEFYAPWCGYCQKMKGVMERASKNLQDIVQVASVNCDLAKNKPLCAQYRIQGFPTLMVFRPPKVNFNKPTGDTPRLSNHASEVYKGERKLRPIVDFSVSRVKNYVKRLLRLEKLSDAIKDKTKRYSVVLFAKKENTSPLYKSIALDWLGTLEFFTIANNKVNKLTDFDLKTHPNIETYIKGIINTVNPGDSSRLVVFDGQEDKYYVFDGESFNKVEIAKFLSNFAQANEGPLTKRQEFLDHLKLGGAKNKKSSKSIIHDEL